MEKWFNVNENCRVWAGHSDEHKQGIIIAPAAILAIEEYKGSFRFKEWKVDLDGQVALDDDPSYPEYWIRQEDVSVLPYNPDPDPDPEPVPESPSDEEIGRVVRYLFHGGR